MEKKNIKVSDDPSLRIEMTPEEFAEHEQLWLKFPPKKIELTPEEAISDAYDERIRLLEESYLKKNAHRHTKKKPKYRTIDDDWKPSW